MLASLQRRFRANSREAITRKSPLQSKSGSFSSLAPGRAPEAHHATSKTGRCILISSVLSPVAQRPGSALALGFLKEKIELPARGVLFHLFIPFRAVLL